MAHPRSLHSIWLKPRLQAAVLLMYVLPFCLVHNARADEGDLLTVPELLVPKRGQDLSAYRFDSEVFGWNKEFTQVASIVSDVTRGPEGKHRGEIFLAVYPVGHSIPVHNVQVHVVTHADAHDDPTPLDDIRDMLWTLENPIWLDKWPKRPRHKQPAGWMHVTPIWDPMAVDTQAHSVEGPSGFEDAPSPSEEVSCTPGVGFVLRYRGHTRVVPHIAIDLKARCDLLKMTQNRIYWGRADVAVDMARFEFSPRATNEQSARFVVSAAWRQGETVRFVASAGHPMDLGTRRLVTQATRDYGSVRFVVQGKPKAPADIEALVAMTAAPKFLPLARRIARNLGAGPIDIAADDSAKATLTLYFGVPKALVPKEAAAPSNAANASPSLAGAAGAQNQSLVMAPNAASTMQAPDRHPVFGTTIPQRLVDSPNPESASLPQPDKARDTPPMTPIAPKTKSYLDDWRVP